MIFFISSNLRKAIVQTAIEEPLHIRQENLDSLENQQERRKEKEEYKYMKKIKNMHQNKNNQNKFISYTVERATQKLLQILIVIWQH